MVDDEIRLYFHSFGTRPRVGKIPSKVYSKSSSTSTVDPWGRIHKATASTYGTVNASVSLP